MPGCDSGGDSGRVLGQVAGDVLKESVSMGKNIVKVFNPKVVLAWPNPKEMILVKTDRFGPHFMRLPSMRAFRL